MNPPNPVLVLAFAGLIFAGPNGAPKAQETTARPSAKVEGRWKGMSNQRDVSEPYPIEVEIACNQGGEPVVCTSYPKTHHSVTRGKATITDSEIRWTETELLRGTALLLNVT